MCLLMLHVYTAFHIKFEYSTNACCIHVSLDHSVYCKLIKVIGSNNEPCITELTVS